MKPELTLELPPEERADYGFTFEPYDKRVRVEFAGVTVADSSRVMVMRETRLPPVLYFPLDDVRMDLTRRNDHRTHCPFKGNASYWDLVVGERRLPNAMWGYEQPLPDARGIAGYIAFYRDLADRWFEDDVPVQPASADLATHGNPLLTWLVREAPNLKDPKALTNELAQKMVETGIPLLRLNVIIRTLHPQMMASAFQWWRARDEVGERLIPYSVLSDPRFINSPLAPIFDGAGGIRRRLDIDSPVLDFPILEELYNEGATDYVAMPITFSDGQLHALTLASDRRGGFSTADLGYIYEILALLARLYEVHALRRTAVTLLDTYLGRHAGERVLNGQIKRGDKENIHAVIWFCDLRESTPLAQSMSTDDFLGALNEFFDCMAGAVLDHGGHVLRFIGDAALAMFPLSGGHVPDRALTMAVDAARDARDRMRVLNDRRQGAGHRPFEFGIALHVGEVTYGNIGTENRLEFTVVGEAANRAARIESMCKTLGRSVLLSDAVARFFPQQCERLGQHTLRGVNEPVAIYALL